MFFCLFYICLIDWDVMFWYVFVKGYWNEIFCFCFVVVFEVYYWLFDGSFWVIVVCKDDGFCMNLWVGLLVWGIWVRLLCC